MHLITELVGRLIRLKFRRDDSSVWSYFFGIQIVVGAAILCVIGYSAPTHASSFGFTVDIRSFAEWNATWNMTLDCPRSGSAMTLTEELERRKRKRST